MVCVVPSPVLKMMCVCVVPRLVLKMWCVCSAETCVNDVVCVCSAEPCVKDVACVCSAEPWVYVLMMCGVCSSVKVKTCNKYKNKDIYSITSEYR